MEKPLNALSISAVSKNLMELDIFFALRIWMHLEYFFDFKYRKTLEKTKFISLA